MMRSMYSAVAGLRVHQTKMDVIGNNIANVNTVGFKRSAVTFQEIYNQTIRGAGSPQGGIGGTNPQQIGLGVNVAAITVDHSKGAPQSTGYTTDLMVDGAGYFVLSNDVNAQNRFYTRAGNFIRDEDGYLVSSSNGYKVLDENMKPIQISKSETKNATATDGIEIDGNINLNDDEYTTTVDIYDSLGDVHTLTVKFSNLNKTPTSGSGSERQVDIYNEDDLTTPIYTGTIAFDTSGNYTGLDPTTTATTPITINVNGAEDIKFHMDDTVFQNDKGESILTQTSNESNAKCDQLSGNAAGSLDDFTISTTGEVVGMFTNGEKKVLGRIGLTNFDNPSGLLKVGSNMFIDTPNSGTPRTGAPSSGSFGSLIPGSLEMSNVDLSVEFTDMISTQRGFQANSRVITTTDEMLQELVNLKR